MPYKALSAPRKHNDIGAEVRAGAVLLNPGLVAKVSTGPVRLAVTPFGGTGGKITNVSLEGADGVALLSRDVALVRGSDDSVWALLDITHTPKMDQVGRDVRSLCMRPSGESALALGWDGSATSLKLNRFEVDARQFALRGAIRAADLTETETYAVVDGPDGGQLRIHMGATPEPAATGRVSLPSQAASFDRVKGGQRLTAIYKKGSRIVCLVTGGPARLTVKLVELDSEPNDVAVHETSLVAVFPDGSAVLYDADAIAAAGDSGPMAAKHSLSLGARGEPRTALLPTKGSPTLWVGTAAGEVVSVSVLRKGSI
jgi:hypothetical protein